MIHSLNCAGKQLDLSSTHVMGILNVTSDSFSDGGKFLQSSDAIARAMQMIEEGVSIIDIGGESTRPGAQPVSDKEELARVLPVINALVAENISVPISIDTSKAEVMRQAVQTGASMINDVRALQEPGALQVAADANVPVCIMHMLGEPRTMQKSPQYNNVIEDIALFLEQRKQVCIEAGVSASHIVLDPGFGFGKTLEQNLCLLKNLEQFLRLEQPLLVGLSRKSMIGAILENEADERVNGSIACAVIAAMKGVSIIRVHDVKQTVDALKIVEAMNSVN